MLEWKPRLIVLMVLLVALAAFLGSLGWGVLDCFSLGW
jgi:hypothetical protein